MKRFWAMILAAVLLCMASAPALAEFDDMEDMDYWYEQLVVLSDDIGMRYVGHEGEILARNYLRSEFERLGFSAENGTLREYAVSNSESTDLEAVLPAANSSDTNEILVICAHYDSAYPWAEKEVPGTRDNASGVAGMLALARKFVSMPAYENTELRFVTFTSEETGHQGSQAYVENLSMDELDRIIGVFNLDLITVDVWLTNHVFSCDTMGMRSTDGYVEGTEEEPAVNKVARAVIAAIEELEYFDPSENGETYCVPRHYGMSDHDTFHAFGVDSANIAFRGNVEEGGNWHPYMHQEEDSLGDLDYERTYQALNIVFTAVSNLAADPAYGD